MPEEAAGEATLVEEGGTGVADEEGGLGGNVGLQASRSTCRHLDPRRTRRRARSWVDQVVLPAAAAKPAPLRAAARREAADDEAHRVASRERDVERTARGEIAAGTDETVA
jgi:hypothetical protein